MITIIALVISFIAGTLAGTIILLRAGITREEKDHSLMRKPANRACAVTRRIVDFSTEIPQR